MTGCVTGMTKRKPNFILKVHLDDAKQTDLPPSPLWHQDGIFLHKYICMMTSFNYNYQNAFRCNICVTHERFFASKHSGSYSQVDSAECDGSLESSNSSSTSTSTSTSSLLLSWAEWTEHRSWNSWKLLTGGIFVFFPRKKNDLKKDTLMNVENTDHFVVNHLSFSIFERAYRGE